MPEDCCTDSAAGLRDLVTEALDAAAGDRAGVGNATEHATWAEVARRARGIAEDLRTHGVTAGDTVLVALPEGPRLLAAWIGVLHVGATCLTRPVTETAPLDAAARESGARATVAADGVRPRPEPRTPAPWSTAGNHPVHVLPAAGPDGAAVALSHAALTHRALRWARLLRVEPVRPVVCAAGATSDTALGVAFAALLGGAELTFTAPGEWATPPPDAALPGVPAEAGAWVVTDAARDAALGVLHAGAHRTHTLLAVHEGPARTVPSPGAPQGTRLVHCFAPPAAGVVAAAEHGAADAGVGTPLPGVRLLVLGDHAEELPEGVPGTLCVAGAGLGDCRAVAPRFPGETWYPHEREPLYRTGERAVHHGSGAVHLLAAPEPATPPRDAPALVAEEPAAPAGDPHLARAREIFAEALFGAPEAAPDLPEDTDFFAYGGHSLLAARMIARASREAGADLPLHGFLADPTLPGLAALLRDLAPAARPEPETRTVFPATSGQRRLWFLNQVPEFRSAYLVPSVLEIEGPVDGGRLRDAVRRVLGRHPALRSRFEPQDGGRGLGYRTDGPPPAVALVDAEHWEASQLEDHVRRFCGKPFTLEQEPPVRAEVLVGAAGATVVLCAHHIAVDGSSLDVLFEQVAKVYRATARAQEPELPEAVHPATLLRGAAQGAARDRLGEVVRALEAAPTDVDLPHDRPRGTVQDTRGASCPVPLAPRTAEALRELGGTQGVTLFMSAATALAVALGRRTGQRDFLFAYPWGGRAEDRATHAVGMLIDTAVLRVRLDGAGDWRAQLARTREAALHSFRYADVPFDDVVAAVHPDRDLARPPLTPVQISVRRGVPAAPDLGEGLRCRLPEPDFAHTKFELVLDVVEAENGELTVELGYATALFDAATVRELAAELGSALDRMAARPESSPWPGGDSAPRARPSDALDTTGAGVLPYAIGPLPGDPAATAVVHQGIEVPRGVLDAWAWGVAGTLRDAGVGPGDVVPVVTGKGPELLAGWLGVLRAGAAYVPVSPDLPAARMAFLMADTGACAALVDAAGAVALARCDTPVQPIPVTGRRSAPLTAAPLTGGDAACVLYTSGTTGTPKGVVVEHRNLAAYLAGLHRTHPRLRGARHLLASTPHTDFAATVLHGALASGGSLCLADEEESLDGEALAELTRRHGTEVAKFTPSHLQALLGTGFRAVVGALPVLILGGEQASAALARELRALRPVERTTTVNHYGPTETTVGVLTHLLAADEGPDAPPPLGLPLPGVRTAVLDDAARPVPDGTPGTLWIGGPTVTRGYLRRPEATAAAFRTLPGREEEGLHYRTGDTVVRDDRGRLHYRGRADDQIKVRGHRVEPGELRHALLSLPSVRQAEAFGDPAHGLVAFVVPEDGASTESITGELRPALPPHLLPTRLTAVAEMPLAASGKCDRERLRALLDTAPDAVGAHRDEPAPPAGATTPGHTARDALLAQVRAAWEEVLGSGPAPLDRNFFEAGGNSLLLVALLHRLRPLATVGTPTVGDLFRYPTVRAQAAFLATPAPLAAPRADAGRTAADTPPAGAPARDRAAGRRALLHRTHRRAREAGK